MINDSYGSNSSTGNSSGTTYTIGYRGNTQTYTGSGSHGTVPANSGGARCHKQFTYKLSSASQTATFSGSGQYLNSGSSTSSAILKMQPSLQVVLL